MDKSGFVTCLRVVTVVSIIRFVGEFGGYVGNSTGEREEEYGDEERTTVFALL